MTNALLYQMTLHFLLPCFSKKKILNVDLLPRPSINHSFHFLTFKSHKDRLCSAIWGMHKSYWRLQVYVTKLQYCTYCTVYSTVNCTLHIMVATHITFCNLLTSKNVLNMFVIIYAEMCSLFSFSSHPFLIGLFSVLDTEIEYEDVLPYLSSSSFLGERHGYFLQEDIRHSKEGLTEAKEILYEYVSNKNS